MTATITGWRHPPFGRLDGHSPEDLIQAVAHEALDDAGTSASEVDVVFLGDFTKAVGFRARKDVNDFLPLSAKHLTRMEGSAVALRHAYQEAGASVEDLPFAEAHDCFAIAELMIMEAMGLAEPGQAGDLLQEGATEKDGPLPINRSGGLKAKGHPVGASAVSMHILAARQLTGRAGDIQLNNPQVGICLNVGGGGVASHVSILEPLKA